MAQKWPKWPKVAQIWPKMIQSGPKMTEIWPQIAQNGPRMTQNDPKWPKNDLEWPKIDLEWPKITPKWPKNVARIYALFRNFFLLKSGSANFFAFKMYVQLGFSTFCTVGNSQLVDSMNGVAMRALQCIGAWNMILYSFVWCGLSTSYVWCGL